MAARKTGGARKKTARRKAAARRRGTSTLDRLERELPATLRDFAGQIRAQLGALEKQVERTSLDTRRRAARLLREGSHQLGRLEANGEGGWRRLADPYRRELVRLLKRLEKAVAPVARARRTKTAARRTTRRVASAPTARRVPTAAPPPAPPTH